MGSDKVDAKCKVQKVSQSNEVNRSQRRLEHVSVFISIVVYVSILNLGVNFENLP